VEIELTLIRTFDHCSDSIVELTALLHRSYKQLADLGYQFWATNQTVDQTLERIKDAKCFVSLVDGKIVGTVCFYDKTEKDDSRWYSRADVGRFGQFGVDPDYQKMGLGRALLSIVEEYAIGIGKHHLAMDTAESAYHLIEYYSRLGFEHVEYIQWERVNYRSTVMSKRLGR